MGVLDRLVSRVTSGIVPSIFTPNVTHVGSWDEWAQEITDLAGATPAKLFREQPHLRTVVSFLARNIAQLGLHTYERVSETDRRRDRSSAAARTLSYVDGSMTTYELIYALVGDLSLYDRAHWHVSGAEASPSGLMIRRIPPSWIVPEKSTAFQVQSWRVSTSGQSVVVPADQILSFTGYSPTNPTKGSPTVEALRDTLQEQMEAALYRKQVWKRGGRVSAVIERPSGAPEWSEGAREAFREDWYAKFTGRGSKAGGTPILEDGMQLKRIDFSAREQEYVEAAKLSLTTVAAAFHVNPTMIGQNDAANYSNVREFRKMLYGDTLGPILAQIEDRLNAFLLPMLQENTGRIYCEFNIAEKLQGSFEEQAAAYQAAVGAPWMATGEARARMNLPALPNTDQLIVPLNVLVGGQASPVDGQTAGGGGSIAVNQEADDIAKRINAAAQLIRSGFSPAASLQAVGLDPSIEHLGLLPVTVQREGEKASNERGVKVRDAASEGAVRESVVAFLSRQERVVKSRIGAGGEGWWDTDRWDAELSEALLALALATTTEVGRETLRSAGIEPDQYDVDRTRAYLAEATAGDASRINATSRERIDAALGDPAALASVFENDKASRADQMAVSLITGWSGFAAVEAARQQSEQATKTWVVNSGNPRSSHARLNGQTVPIDSTFSNGMKWPGAFGNPAEVAGCQCSVTVNIPEGQS